MTSTTDDLALYEVVAPHIAVATLNRPAVRNAVNRALAEQLEAIVERIETDDDIWVGILASSNDRVFCAGADLAEILAGKSGGTTRRGGFAGFIDFDRQKPWIAAVRGAALGGGCELALACDMIVASETASFGLPEVKRSLLAGAGGVYRLPRAIPRNIAYEMIATGDPISAERARELGLANRLASDAEVLAAAVELANAVVKSGPLAVRASLKIARAHGDATDAELRARANEAFRELGNSRDFAEGPRAFLEKRAPVWQGR